MKHESKLFKQLHQIYRLDLGEDMEATQALIYAFLNYKSYRYKSEVVGDHQDVADRFHGDVEAAFIDEINCVKAHDNYNCFATICEAFIEPMEAMRTAPIAKPLPDLSDIGSTITHLTSTIPNVNKAA